MANPNPKTEQLSLGRGKRPKLNHETVAMRMSPATKHALEKIAQRYNCTYGDKPWIAGLLERIGCGDLVVSPPAAYSIEDLTDQPAFEHNKILGDAMMEKYHSPIE